MAIGPKQLWDQEVAGRQMSRECWGAGAQRELRERAWAARG